MVKTYRNKSKKDKAPIRETIYEIDNAWMKLAAVEENLRRYYKNESFIKIQKEVSKANKEMEKVSDILYEELRK